MAANSNTNQNTSTSSNKGYLFYSSICDMSKHLLGLFESEGLLRYFILIDIYKNPKAPPQIQKTPTLIIKSIPTPFIGPDAFDWLARVKQWKMQTLMTQTNQQIMGTIGPTDEWLGFSAAEMNSISDNFAFYNKDISKEYSDAMPQNYCTIDSFAESRVIWTPPENDRGKIENETEAKMKSILEQKRIEQERQEQDKLVQTRTCAISKDILANLEQQRALNQKSKPRNSSSSFSSKAAAAPRKFAPNLRR
jgi:hypothetical protein